MLPGVISPGALTMRPRPASSCSFVATVGGRELILTEAPAHSAVGNHNMASPQGHGGCCLPFAEQKALPVQQQELPAPLMGGEAPGGNAEGARCVDLHGAGMETSTSARQSLGVGDGGVLRQRGDLGEGLSRNFQEEKEEPGFTSPFMPPWNLGPNMLGDTQLARRRFPIESLGCCSFRGLCYTHAKPASACLHQGCGRGGRTVCQGSASRCLHDEQAETWLRGGRRPSH